MRYFYWPSSTSNHSEIDINFKINHNILDDTRFHNKHDKVHRQMKEQLYRNHV